MKQFLSTPLTSIALGISGASGLPYSLRLLEYVLKLDLKIYLMISSAAKDVFRLEANIDLPQENEAIRDFFKQKFQVPQASLHVLSDKQWTSIVASGSAREPQAMVVCPCSSSCLSAIANGASDNLLERAADVMIKEQRQLILVHRETPLSVIHLENMLKLARLGVTILPASPGFYHRPHLVEDLVDFVVGRILNLLHIDNNLGPKWGYPSS